MTFTASCQSGRRLDGYAWTCTVSGTKGGGALSHSSCECDSTELHNAAGNGNAMRNWTDLVYKAAMDELLRLDEELFRCMSISDVSAM